MTRKESIAVIDRLQHTESKWPGTEDTLEALDMAIKALRTITREQVEKMRGEWIFNPTSKVKNWGEIQCSRCHFPTSFGGENALHNAKRYNNFCQECGAPMTDKAVEILLKRLEEMQDAE